MNASLFLIASMTNEKKQHIENLAFLLTRNSMVFFLNQLILERNPGFLSHS